MGWGDEGLAALEGGRDEDCGGGEEKGKKEFGNCVRGGVFSEWWILDELRISDFKIGEWFGGEEESAKCIHYN
jgi:hypothetical protein